VDYFGEVGFDAEGFMRSIAIAVSVILMTIGLAVLGWVNPTVGVICLFGGAALWIVCQKKTVLVIERVVASKSRRQALDAQVATKKRIREQFEGLSTAEKEAVKHVRMNGHILPQQVTSHLANQGFADAAGVIDSIRSKTPFLLGSFSGEFSINPDLKDFLDELLYPPLLNALSRGLALFVIIIVLFGCGYLFRKYVYRSDTLPSSTDKQSDNPKLTQEPSSFPFIMGAPLGDNNSGAWQMLGLTFGPILQDYNCDLQLSDLQRDKAKTGNYKFALHVGKSPRPGATFPWFPDNPDYQHYKVEINCPDRSYDEDWEVGRVHGQLRTKLTIAKVYPFGQPPEIIYSCVDHVSGRIDASTVLQPQDRYVSKPGWQPNHRYEFPNVIQPIHKNPGHFFYVMKVQNPGCWKCLQEDCGVETVTTPPQAPAQPPPTQAEGAITSKQSQVHNKDKTEKQKPASAKASQSTYSVTNPTGSIVNQNSPNLGSQTVINEPPERHLSAEEIANLTAFSNRLPEAVTLDIETIADTESQVLASEAKRALKVSDANYGTGMAWGGGHNPKGLEVQIGDISDLNLVNLARELRTILLATDPSIRLTKQPDTQKGRLTIIVGAR